MLDLLACWKDFQSKQTINNAINLKSASNVCIVSSGDVTSMMNKD
ncbi:hypothetical protein A3Q56_08088 [Intoshia linei]|uniref:Uncharacterized protein n=1 Tax=Intoshia linei TaxID=1819745 RepID=A0A177AQF4_9BILA|nr:hypothetical protein A3Q56_08088 [Intoshia linei]